MPLAELRRSSWRSPSLAAGAVAAAWLFTAYSWHRSDVPVQDILVFSAYVVLGLALPGVVLWRMLTARTGWTLLADLACGTSLAYGVELGVYLVCAHLDHPGIAAGWPMIPLLASLHPRLRGRVWRRAGAPGSPGLTGVLSGLVVFAVAHLTRVSWDAYPIRGVDLRAPYVDEPYHLSLIGALSRHVPVDVPAVAGDPLYYHWFAHADLAAARHATGIEPFLLLSRLGPIAWMVVVIVGVAALARRLTGSSRAGALAAFLLCCAGGAPLSRDLGNLFLSGYIFLSPTTVFAMTLLIATAAVSFELLRPGDARPGGRVGLWLAAVLMLGAISGAKGPLLPLFLAGFASTLLLTLIVDRRVQRAAAGLLAVGLVWFVVSQDLVYGGSSQGTGLEPFGIGERMAVSLGVAGAGRVSTVLAAAITLMYLVSRTTLWAGAAGLFSRDVWRDPRAQVLFAGALASVGAVAAFDNEKFNQVYFLLVAPPLMAVGSAWGLVALVRRLPARFARRAVLVAVATGLVIGWLAKELFADRVPEDYSAARLLLPPALAVLGCVLAGLLAGLLADHLAGGTPVGGPHRRLVGVLVAATALTSLGVPAKVEDLATMVTSPRDQFASTSIPRRPTIGVGGIRAARWLRDHSDPGDLVATNEHCRIPEHELCDHRTTWIAGFSERQLLLEGWAYSPTSGKTAEEKGEEVAYVDFWSPRRLRDNDRAFTSPTPASVGRLRDTYGVDWLIVDRRFPADVPGLRKVAQQRFHTRQYVVFELR